MQDLTLSKNAKKELYEKFVEKGLDPIEFNWLETAHYNPAQGVRQNVSRLVHELTKSFFTFGRYGAESWDISYAPGKYKKEDHKRIDSWHDILITFLGWCDLVKIEEEPDAWELAKQNKLTEASEIQEYKTAKFTNGEQKVLPNALKEIKEFIISHHELTQSQQLLLGERFDVLELASRDASKQAWILMLIGALFSVLTSVVSSPQQWQELFNFAFECLRPVLEAPLLLR
jgi:hypothetical protein